MNNQIELVAEERVVSGKRVRYLRRQGVVPGNLYGHGRPSISMQVNGKMLQEVLAHGGQKFIIWLKVGNHPGVQALIKKVQHDPISGEITHVEFYQVAATETLKTNVQLQFINEAPAISQGGATVLRSLSEVMVECLPADLPSTIQVDLSQLREAGDVIRVGDLKVGPEVTILTDPDDMVAGLHQQSRSAKADEPEEKAEGTAVAPGTLAQRAAER